MLHTVANATQLTDLLTLLGSAGTGIGAATGSIVKAPALRQGSRTWRLERRPEALLAA
jgi:hypothetical protein